MLPHFFFKVNLKHARLWNETHIWYYYLISLFHRQENKHIDGESRVWCKHSVGKEEAYMLHTPGNLLSLQGSWKEGVVSVIYHINTLHIASFDQILMPCIFPKSCKTQTPILYLLINFLLTDT